MAYITKEKVAEIRKNLKAAFPDWKFSLRMDRHTSIHLAVVKAPYNVFEDFNPVDRFRDPHDLDQEAYDRCVREGNAQVNHYWLDGSDTWQGKTKEAFKKMSAICNEGNHDNSDIQSDYFDVGWYFTMAVGKWNKPVEIK